MLKTLKIKEETHTKLCSFAEKGVKAQTFDEIINKLMEKTKG